MGSVRVVGSALARRVIPATDYKSRQAEQLAEGRSRVREEEKKETAGCTSSKQTHQNLGGTHASILSAISANPAPDAWIPHESAPCSYASV